MAIFDPPKQGSYSYNSVYANDADNNNNNNNNNNNTNTKAL